MKLSSTSDSGSINKLAECLFVIPEYCITVVLSVGLQDRNFNASENSNPFKIFI